MDLEKTFDKIESVVDDNVFSGEEKAQVYTDRLKLDLTSRFALPHLIRPILSLWAAGLFSFALIYGMIAGIVNGTEAMLAASAPITSAIIFYFDSRKKEKTLDKKIAASIQIEELKLKAQIKADKKKDRHERQAERRSRREPSGNPLQ